MGQLKQLHIDCEVDNCVAGEAFEDTCYVQNAELEDSSPNPED